MSITIIGLVVSVLSTLAKGAGVDIGSDALTDFLLTGGQLVGVAGVWFGRFRKGDLKIWGTRK